LNPRNQPRSQTSRSYTGFGRNETRTQSGKKDNHGRSAKRQARSPKRRTHSVDSDLVSGFQEFCVLHALVVEHI